MLLPLLYHHCASFGRPIASIDWSLWRPFGDHDNPWATMIMVLPPLCLLCTTYCATTAVLVVQGTHKGRAAAVTQKQNFLGLVDHWASWWIFWSLNGGTNVAALCKGRFRDTLSGDLDKSNTMVSVRTDIHQHVLSLVYLVTYNDHLCQAQQWIHSIKCLT